MKGEHLFDSETKLKRFGYGEWLEEPDFAEFEHTGFLCHVMRNPFGCWCGYVRIPKVHPWHGKDYDSIDADIHGGLTFSQNVDDNYPEKSGYWIGFDCGHFGDFCPSSVKSQRELDNIVPESIPEEMKIMRKHLYERMGSVPYRNLEYVVNETKKLATQAKEAMEKANEPT
jgi:hypothetical protein